MSCVHLTQEVERTTELLSVVRDWTNGKASDEKLNKAYDELWELYRKSNYSPAAARAAAAAANIPKQDIISSIEKEIEMPLEDFLFKNKDQEVNESLIRSLISHYHISP